MNKFGTNRYLTIVKNALILITIFPLIGCNGRFVHLHNKMTACGYPRVSFSEFNSCMDNSLTPTQGGHQDYYARTNQEIRNTLNALESEINLGLINEDDAYVGFNEFVNKKIIEERESAKTAGTIVAVGMVGVAGAACINNGCGGGNYNSNYYYSTPLMCASCSNCTVQCDIGKACGDTCISVTDTCHVGRGLACNTYYRSYP